MVEVSILNPQISIRQSTLRELPQVVSLIEGSGLSANKEPGYVQQVVGANSRTTLVAEKHGEIVGAVVIQEAYWPGFGINYIVVDEGHRGQRIGERLMSRAEDEVRSRGGTRIILVVENNDPGLVDFYRKYGYEKQLGEPIEMKKDF